MKHKKHFKSIEREIMCKAFIKSLKHRRRLKKAKKPSNKGHKKKNFVKATSCLNFLAVCSSHVCT